MSPDFTREVLRIFDESRSAENRELFLDMECGEDAVLRQEVDSLLAAEAESLDFMEEPLLSLPVLPKPELQAGDVIGKYRIVRSLGHGGMGAVYLAVRQEPGFEVQAAIKLIRPGRDGEQVISRFLQEHEYLSKLDHQNIAKPFDRGTTPEGLPYLVMEHVQGEPIDKYCNSNKLDTTERLNLFRKVCGAVHFAHQNLIVHRDLKPGNILVNSQGEPKLLDFGVASMVDPSPYSTSAETLRQSTAGFFGTLKYASPEQVLNEERITTVSDIYSLGILLYELLTGHHPFQKWTESFIELANAICEKDPEKPSTAVGLVEEVRSSDGTQSTLHPQDISADRSDQPGPLSRRLSGDLDRIVLKALCKRPEDRYGSAKELADDIERHLNGLPISAREPTLSYQLAKFYQRHKGAVRAAAGFLLLIVFFGFTSLWLWQREQEAREEVEDALMVSDYLVELWAARNPTDAETLPAKKLLDDGVAAIEQAIELADLPESERDDLESQIPSDVPGLLEAYGWAYYGLGVYEDAEDWLSQSLERRRNAQTPPDEHFVTTLLHLAAAKTALGQDSQAAEMRTEATDILRSGKVDDGRLAQLLNERGLLLLDRGDLENAATFFEEAAEMKKRLSGDHEASISIALTNLGKIREMLGRYQEAEGAYRESLRIKQVIYGEDSERLAILQNNLAVLLTDMGLLEPDRQERLWAEAEELFEKSLEGRLQSSPPDHPRAAKVYKNHALLLIYRNELESAEALLDKALEIFRREYGDTDRAVAETLRHRAALYQEVGRTEDAERDARRAALIFDDNFGEEDWRSADVRSILGECLFDMNQSEEATTLLTTSLEILEDAKGENARATWEAKRRWMRMEKAESASSEAPTDS